MATKKVTTKVEAPEVELHPEPANTTPEPEKVVPTQETKGNKVEVDADVLQNILNKVSELEEQQKQYEQTATQDQIRKIEALRASGKLVKSVKLRRFRNKLVIGWVTTTDDVYFADGKLIERQTLKIILEGGDELEEVTQVEFTRGCTYESYEVIKEAKIDGDMEYTVMLPNGKELTIAGKFVN